MSLVMIDSGACSVWSKGADFPIEHYIDFCLKHPGADYYVNLDILLGKKGQRIKSFGMVEESCRGSWRNYLTMIKHLPQEKVVAVFHKGEDFSWLHKYLDAGCPYIGIGQSNSGSDRALWFRALRNEICGKDGKPVVKTHGFAVTGLDAMRVFPWHSVDSASWVKSAVYGMVHIPRVGVGGKHRYDRPPH